MKFVNKRPSTTGKRKRENTYSKTNKKFKGDGNTRTGGFYGRYNLGETGKASAERKQYETWANNVAIPSAKVLILDSLVKIAAGTASNQRVGRKIILKSIHLKGHLASSKAVQADKYRIIIGLDTQANGTSPTVTDVLSNGPSGAPDIYSFLNLANSRRFKILRDIKLLSKATLYDSNNSNYGVDLIPFDANISCDIPVEYATIGNAMTDIKSNNIFIIFLNFYSLTVTGEQTLINLMTRIRYEDL